MLFWGIWHGVSALQCTKPRCYNFGERGSNSRLAVNRSCNTGRSPGLHWPAEGRGGLYFLRVSVMLIVGNYILAKYKEVVMMPSRIKTFVVRVNEGGYPAAFRELDEGSNALAAARILHVTDLVYPHHKQERNPSKEVFLARRVVYEPSEESTSGQS